MTFQMFNQRCQSTKGEHIITHIMVENSIIAKIANLAQNMNTKAQHHYVHQTWEANTCLTNKTNGHNAW